jgi:UDP-N-acetylglucosamine 2-epimerase (non-hydrolysing)
VTPSAVRILSVVGARPNFMKIAPLIGEMRHYTTIESVLVHTGQHYDDEMSRVFFDELRLPRPHVDLAVGSGSHARQTAQVMERFEPVVTRVQPALVVVVGDVNSTLACALVAVKCGVPVAHVEAGLRSHDRSMPEEINRLLTDAIAEWLFTPSEDANENLRREGISGDRIHLVGNVMVDALVQHRARAEQSSIRRLLGLEDRAYGLASLHRPVNVDDPAVLGGILSALNRVGRTLPIVFPAHPRTVERMRAFGLGGVLDPAAVRIVDPLGYIDFLHLEAHARLVLTDSGGVQEETTVLGVPCLTLRLNTERPVTVTEGTNTVVGNKPDRIVAEAERVLRDGRPPARRPRLWDGRAAERVLAVLAQRYRLVRSGGRPCAFSS